jgi:hypothetical protein
VREQNKNAGAAKRLKLLRTLPDRDFIADFLGVPGGGRDRVRVIGEDLRAVQTSPGGTIPSILMSSMSLGKVNLKFVCHVQLNSDAHHR